MPPPIGYPPSPVTAVVIPAVTNVSVRMLRSVTSICCDQRCWFAMSSGSWLLGSSLRWRGSWRQVSPSNTSRSAAFQYAGIDALTRSSSRPSRGQFSGL